jgi:hypothetical protein
VPSTNGFSRQLRHVSRYQVGVHDEAPRGEDDAARERDAGLAERSPPHPGDLLVRDDQLSHASLVPDGDAELGSAAHEQVDDQPRTLHVAGDRDLVAARSRDGQLAKRPDLLVAGVHQALGLRLDDRLVRVVAALELKSQVLEPVTVLGAAVRVGTDFVRLRLGRDRHEVGVHLVGCVVVTGSTLHDSAAAKVEVAACHRTRAACGRGSLQDLHRRARRRRLDCGAAAGNAEAEHEDVELVWHKPAFRL